ncbi:PLP-dependent cysteine synthase family protein [Helicobacter zhangjianzhongii]|uniref:Cysteine synthase family protein n=1 Tax=Helicobacter zhangjianzhongii TaxID=2974574 RepID=A0ACC6FSP8_9HELI|nr:MULTISPECIES: cysteine synthase family protein [unclassified Helicobacter]MDL0080149.1 cysteine synthase family protein [Helicobacter sp. CPD2-1]MDL0081938.1 cysteine synthase family protein [Helicobacter sp. XJK30-2]
MLFYSSLDLIGNTPLVELSRIQIPNNNRIFAKLESYNPAGGVKDRVALHILQRAKKQGKLHKDSVVIEATAGNTGLGIAFVCLHFNIKAILVVPDKFSIEKQILMRALGAEVINTPKELGIQGAIDKAKELLDSTPHSFSLHQFENPLNPQAHYETSGKEIYTQMQGVRDLAPVLDYFVCGAGSGGSFSGIAKYLKEQDSRIQAVLCDPIGSVIGGGEEGCANIEGIGNNFIPKTMDTSFIDMVQKISDEEAYQGLKILAREEGLLVGISSGACLQACLKLARQVENKLIVTLFADHLSRYFSKNLI